MRRAFEQLVLGVALAVTVTATSAAPSASPYANPYFDSVDRALRDPQSDAVDAAGEALVFLDLDALDVNIGVVKNEYLTDSQQLRVVTKSLPAVELLTYILTATGSNRLMVFRTNMLQTLLTTLTDKTYDYLLGVPFTATAADRLLNVLLNGPQPVALAAIGQVQWLVDTLDRAKEYNALAVKYNITLRVNLEIDIGLHRGGAFNASVMLQTLSYVSANAATLQWSGFMGYDGHVPNDPRIQLFGNDWFYRDLNDAAVAYHAFIDAARNAFPQYFAPTSPPLTFNGAGTLTLGSYRSGLNSTVSTPLNDYSMGSGFVKPSDFDFFALTALVPALWMASPVLKAMASQDCVPFVPWEWLEHEFPQWFCNGYFLSGAGLHAITLIDPPGLMADPFYGGSGDVAVNLLPTQALYHSNCSLSLPVGQHVFFRPFEGDIMVAFNQVVLLRGTDHIVIGRWGTYRGGV